MAGSRRSAMAAVAAWRSVPPSLLVREDAAAKASASAKIAGFDLNDTLVTSRIGAPGYQVTVADWQYYNANVLTKLREAHEQGFKLVIFTNQGNIRAALDGKRAQAVREYIDAFLADLKLPVQVLAATMQDRFRKPSIGMWDYLESKANNMVAVDRAQSFYVGDAAGGPGEHSAADSEFARAVGVKFIHARDYFGVPVGVLPSSSSGSGSRSAERPGKAPRLSGLAASRERGDPSWQGQLSDVGRLEPSLILVLVGAPGCGKSTFATCLGPPAPAGPRASAKANGGGLAGRERATWRRVCQDLLGNKDACMRAASSCLQQGLSVVVDRTNYNSDQRSGWLELAERQGLECHCLVFDIPGEECCRRVATRPVHEGGLAGGGRMIVMKLFNMLEPVGGTEAFSRVTVVRTTDQLEEEVRRYCGDQQYSPSGPAGASTGGGGSSASASTAAAAATPARSASPAGLQPPGPAAAAGLRGSSPAAGRAAAAIATAVPASAPARGLAGTAAATATAVPASAPARGLAGTAATATAVPASASARGLAGTAMATAPAATAASGRATGTGPRTRASAAEEKVDMLVSMGFPREACKSALESAGGDANVAANRLLADRLLTD